MTKETQGSYCWTKYLKFSVSVRQSMEIAEQGLKPANKAGIMFKVMIISMCFCLDVSYVLRELKEREEIRNFAGILDVPNTDDFYRFKSRVKEENFIKVVNGILKLFEQMVKSTEHEKIHIYTRVKYVAINALLAWFIIMQVTTQKKLCNAYLNGKKWRRLNKYTPYHITKVYELLIMIFRYDT